MTVTHTHTHTHTHAHAHARTHTHTHTHAHAHAHAHTHTHTYTHTRTHTHDCRGLLGELSAVVQASPTVQDHLGPALLHTYSAVHVVEGLDVDKENFDKFATRSVQLAPRPGVIPGTVPFPDHLMPLYTSLIAWQKIAFSSKT